MSGTIRGVWTVLRSRYWTSLLFDVVLLILVFLLISAWQTRNLPDDEHMPRLESVWLDDMRAENVIEPGQTGVIYFFAPWCFYCKKSIDNLDSMVASGDLAWARVVALNYESLDEVRDFLAETGVSLPVLLGNAQTSTDWQISAFPTYFVIDENGDIASRSVGYSTSIGLRARVWSARD